MFHFSRYHQTVFQTGRNNLFSKQQDMRVSVAPHPLTTWYYQSLKKNFSHYGG